MLHSRQDATGLLGWYQSPSPVTHTEMVRFRPTRFGRYAALLAAILFAALTLVASGPHHHLYGARTGRYAAVSQIPGAESAAVAPAFSAPIDPFAAVDCPLCDWLSVPALLVLCAFSAILPLLVRSPKVASCVVASQCCLPLPCRCPRGPPTFSR